MNQTLVVLAKSKSKVCAGKGKGKGYTAISASEGS